MIEAQEERKQQGYTSGSSADTGSVATPSLPASPPSFGQASSMPNSARPKGLLDIDYTTLKPGALSPIAGPGTSAPVQTPSNTLFGSSGYVPYQPYTSPSYQPHVPPSHGELFASAVSPAPTLQVPIPAPGLAQRLTQSLASPIGTAPAPTGPTSGIFGTSVPSLLSGTPFNTAPATSSFFTAAAGLPAPATPGTPLKGLLDQSYVKSPAGDAPLSPQMASAAAQYAAPGMSEGKEEKRGIWHRVKDGAEWVGDKAEDGIGL